MLRIRMTAADLGRVRLARAPALMWETALSVHWLERRPQGMAGAQWLGAVAARPAPGTGLLRHLIPPRGYFPDFLTPYGTSPDFSEALEPVLCTSPVRLRADLALLPSRTRSTPHIRALTTADATAVHRLEQALRRHHDIAVAPFRAAVRESVAREHARASDLMVNGGTETLLADLSPLLRWRAPTLDVTYPTDRELCLEGRGLLLVPSYFCHGLPITLVCQDTTPVLVYPVAVRMPAATPAHDRSDHLAGLLGHSRAAVLEAAAQGGNTSQLARLADILVSSASQHLTVLRRAGLITSQRRANAVVHRVTSLGADLLAGRPAQQSARAQHLA
ncbi:MULTISPECIES: ArsR/SmtB family transcription factor [Streptomyces]|nr:MULTISPECIES: winged helix-turn-helix domain-containing protein [unclassified Streptomyces]MYZ15010.1 ArsR family transcriptional regulator [Streptomyces sp. SID337]NDZ99875.1 winged helix-turn-helix transcriptional regulator [Streptomyces sp. SID10116]MYY83192.1 ArsR family transcriptional regulator [Streptomyces sp. SID335]NDZ85857.1 winged helix-turn-helix transcriptional regulator [Streptomyces sp. SID10115]NEB45750.1 winged helix-turn-helix transcriptional regulator [Streptomyces sp. S